MQKGFIGFTALIAIVLGLIVIGGSAYYLMHQNAATQSRQNLPELSTTDQKQARSQTVTAQAQTTATSNGNTIYTSHQFNFSVSYPDTLQATTSLDSYPGFEHGAIVMALHNINAGGNTTGNWTISVSASADDVKNCMTVPQLDAQEDEPISADYKTVNGIDFVYDEYDSPAAGQFESDDGYRTLRGNTCFDIDESYSGIETPHLQGQDAINNDADIQKVSAELDAITRSFQFIFPVNPAPSCTLMTDKQTYAVGDTIALSWTSQDAVLAIWEQPTNPNQPNTIIPPTQQPATRGTATTIANIAGNQTIALDVAGHGGIASCHAQVSITPSIAHTTVSVNSLHEVPNNTGKSPYAPTVIQMSGTIKNAALLNSSGIDVIFINSSYSGPIDWQDLFWHVNVNDLDNHPLDAGEQGDVSIAGNATTWNAQFYNYMPPGSYDYYIFPSASNGLSTSADLLASGTFNSISWSNNPNVTVIYPRSGSDFFTENGDQTRIYWTVPQSVVSSFPSDDKLSVVLTAVEANEPTTTIDIGTFNFTDGSAIWDSDTAIKNGQLTPGMYNISWNFFAYPKGSSNPCTQTGTSVACGPSASGETGWFSVDK
ncbi:MAG: hypothetical protein ACRDHZ_11215 [Ktedonobacteraceae bacterium]